MPNWVHVKAGEERDRDVNASQRGVTGRLTSPGTPATELSFLGCLCQMHTAEWQLPGEAVLLCKEKGKRAKLENILKTLQNSFYTISSCPTAL